jgi:hypothetical protein
MCSPSSSRTLLLLFVSICALAEDQSSSAVISYTQDFPGSNPGHYEITVNRAGQGVYRSNGQLDQQSEPINAEALKFSLSDNVRERIFSLAKQAHYFAGKVDSGRTNIANTGAKTLAYKDTQRSTTATYNFSQAAPVQELTSVFQALSTTLEFGRRLSYFHKYEKLAIEEDLRRMEELQRDNQLGDVQAISAVLNDIANDQSVINVSRARALRLLTKAGK